MIRVVLLVLNVLCIYAAVSTTRPASTTPELIVDVFPTTTKAATTTPKLIVDKPVTTPKLIVDVFPSTTTTSKPVTTPRLIVDDFSTTTTTTTSSTTRTTTTRSTTLKPTTTLRPTTTTTLKPTTTTTLKPTTTTTLKPTTTRNRKEENEYNPYSRCKSAVNATTVCKNNKKSDFYCDANEFPKFSYNDGDCCFSCRVCDVEAFNQCALSRSSGSIPYCKYSSNGDYHSGNPCCPDCIPPPKAPTCSSSQLKKLPFCAANVIPSLDETSGCPLCVASKGRQCSDETGDDCSYDGLPDCPDNTSPTRDASCCLTCKPVKARKKCSESKKERCQKLIIPTLRNCENDERPAFNSSNCCITCNPVSSLNVPKPSPNASGDSVIPSDLCSREDYKLCAASMPLCNPDDLPIDIPGSCCPSCTRPESHCNAGIVTQCKLNMRACNSGETPSFIPGECCATCKLPIEKPMECAQGCSDGTICARKAIDEVTTIASCVPSVVKKICFNATDDFNQLSNYGIDEIETLLIELLNKFCEGKQRLHICTSLLHRNDLDSLISSISFSSTKGMCFKINAPARLPKADATTTPVGAAADTTTSPVDEETTTQPIVEFLDINKRTLRSNRLMEATNLDMSEVEAIISASSDPYAADGYSTTVNDVDLSSPSVTGNASFSMTLIMIISAAAGVLVILSGFALFLHKKRADMIKRAEIAERYSVPTAFVPQITSPLKSNHSKTNPSNEFPGKPISSPVSSPIMNFFPVNSETIYPAIWNKSKVPSKAPSKAPSKECDTDASRVWSDNPVFHQKSQPSQRH